MQRRSWENVPDTRPFVKSGGPGGQGVNYQNISLDTPDKRPYIKANGLGGMGVLHQTINIPDGTAPLDGSRLRPWIRALADRLVKVIVLHRSWESCVTKPVLMAHRGGLDKTMGVFMDPPYKLNHGHRSKNLCMGDVDASSEDVAVACYEWCVANGEQERLRIAYCCRHGDFDLPDGWTSTIRHFPGVRRTDRQERHMDEIMFSPACLDCDMPDQTPKLKAKQPPKRQAEKPATQGSLFD